MKKNRILVMILLLFPMTLINAQASEKSEVMLMGCFHFANPQRDMVKTDQINVMTPENQQSLEALTDRISQFKPTVVLLEFNPDNEEKVNEEFDKYLEGSFELPSNEIYQLGFRIAKKANLSEVYSFDERTIGWNAKPLYDYMSEHDPVTSARLDSAIAKITKDTEYDHATKTLVELLAVANNEEKGGLNKFLYLMTNPVGAGEKFEGADAAASWWHRNFRMYALIQKYAAPGERVLAIGGQGHITILKDLLEIDQDREAVNIMDYLD